MELNKIGNASVFYSINGGYALTAGQNIKLEVGEEELSEIVPVGKKWAITVSIKIQEQNI